LALSAPAYCRSCSCTLIRPGTPANSRAASALPGSTNRELIKLADVGILLRQQIGNQVHYRANLDCPVFAELAGMLRKTSGMAAVLAQALAPLSDRIQCALVFGSVVRGTERSGGETQNLPDWRSG
jgi:hypothetical protein